MTVPHRLTKLSVLFNSDQKMALRAFYFIYPILVYFKRMSHIVSTRHYFISKGVKQRVVTSMEDFAINFEVEVAAILELRQHYSFDIAALFHAPYR